MGTPQKTGGSVLSTLAMVEQQARRDPRRIALRDGRTTMAIGELHDAVRARARALKFHGVRTLALAADNSTEWVVTDLAAQLAKIAVVPLPAFFSADQLVHGVRSSGADHVIFDRSTLSLRGLLANGEVCELAPETVMCRVTDTAEPAALPPDTAKVSYTSGTTGQPKGVCLSQPGMDQVASSLRAVTAELRLRRHLCILPFATLLENVAGVYAPLQNGGEICVPGLTEIGWTGATGLETSKLLGCIARLGPDSLILVPELLHGLVDALERGACVPDCLKFVAVGGGHVAPDLLERAEALGLPVYQGYGLTEAASVVALSSPGQRRRGSVGRPLAHCALRVEADGEIMVSGAGFCGYAGRDGSRVEEIATGDIGSIDDDGFLYLSGRCKNVFITSYGRNVSPEWVEAEFAAQPSIAQICLFGEARPWNVAVIVPASSVTPEAIERDVAAVNAGLPDYARIGRWIPARQPFSLANRLLTANGRTRRDAVWDAYGQRLDACYEDCISRTA